MKRQVKRFSLSPVVIILVLLFSGCLGGPGPVYYYYLDSPVKESYSFPELELTDREIIAVGPVELSPELKQAGIVVKSGDRNRIKISQNRVWSASLEELMGTAITRDLAIILDTDQVEVYPGGRFAEVQYQVELDVREFSGDLKEEFSCVIIWSLDNSEQGRILNRKRFVSSTPVEGGDYDAYVAAASRILVDLAEEIAAALSAVESR